MDPVLPLPRRADADWYCLMLVPVNRETGEVGNRVVLRKSQWPSNDARMCNHYVPSRANTKEKPVKTRWGLTTPIARGQYARRKHSGANEMRIAMIIECGHNEKMADTVLKLWNTRTRGRIPRAATGALVAREAELDAFADPELLFNSDLHYWRVRVDADSLSLCARTDPAKLETLIEAYHETRDASRPAASTDAGAGESA